MAHDYVGLTVKRLSENTAFQAIAMVRSSVFADLEQTKYQLLGEYNFSMTFCKVFTLERAIPIMNTLK